MAVFSWFLRRLRIDPLFKPVVAVIPLPSGDVSRLDGVAFRNARLPSMACSKLSHVARPIIGKKRHITSEIH